jgi:hypothetical protein
MKKRSLRIILAFGALFALLPAPAWSAALTIGPFASVTIWGGASISLQCQDVVIEDGGRMYLEECNEPGWIYGCRKMTVAPWGSLFLGGGRILGCNIIPQIMPLLMD